MIRILAVILLVTLTLGYKETLVFQDNFDTLDTSKWRHDITLGGGGNWEFEMYYNNRSNSYAKDGILYIQPTLTADNIGEYSILKLLNHSFYYIFFYCKMSSTDSDMTFGERHPPICAQETPSTVAKEPLEPVETTSTQSKVLDFQLLIVFPSNTEESNSEPNYQKEIGFGLPSGFYQDITNTETGPLVEKLTSWKVEETPITLTVESTVSDPHSISVLVGKLILGTKPMLNTLYPQVTSVMISTFSAFTGDQTKFTLIYTSYGYYI